MSIVVRCPNILRYDPQQGKYIYCHHEFRVRDEFAGQSVRCPECDELVAVPSTIQPTTPAAAPPAKKVSPATTAPTGKSQRTPPPESNAAVRPRAAPPAPQSPSPAPPPVIDANDYPELLDEDEEEDGFRLSAPIELPARDFLSSPSLPKPPLPVSPPAPAPPPLVATEQTADEKSPCPSCGRLLLLRSVICPNCGYHKGLQRRVDAFAENDEEKKPTGFERWVRKQLVDGDDPTAIRSVLIVAALLLLAFGAILFLMIGRLFWLLVAIVGAAAAGAWLGWWRLDAWLWLLFLCRLVQWRNPTPPFAHRKVLDLRNMPITDDELSKLQNLHEFEVLDLEGAPVTDQGLPKLYDYRNLNFIILRDTQTTESGVAILQQSLPRAWIWR